MKIRSKVLAFVVVVLFFGGIFVSKAVDMWKTTSSKVPAKYVTGDFEGQSNPGDIRGSYSFGDISAAFEIAPAVLAQAFALNTVENPESFQCKELEELYESKGDLEVGTDSVRLFVALYLGLPYTPNESTRLLSPALQVLKDRVTNMSYEELQDLTVSPSDMRIIITADSEDTHGSTEDDRTIKGKTTFYDLLSWGMNKEEIEDILAMPMGESSMSIRNYVMEKGLEFSEYKTKLQEAVDRLP